MGLIEVCLFWIQIQSIDNLSKKQKMKQHLSNIRFSLIFLQILMQSISLAVQISVVDNYSDYTI